MKSRESWFCSLLTEAQLEAPGASLVAQRQSIRLPLQETQETQVQPLGREDPLEEEMATHSSTLAWKIPWTEEPGGLQPMELL